MLELELAELDDDDWYTELLPLLSDSSIAEYLQQDSQLTTPATGTQRQIHYSKPYPQRAISYYNVFPIPIVISQVLLAGQQVVRLLLLLPWLVPSSGVAGIADHLTPPCWPVCRVVLFQTHLCHVSLACIFPS